MYSKKGVVLYLFYLLHFWSESVRLLEINSDCIRFKHGRVRWHTLAYTARQKIIFKHVQTFCAYRTCALYDKHTLGTR